MNASPPNLFSLGEDIPSETLKSDFAKVEETAHGNPAFAYSMVVPNDYLQIGLEAANARLQVDAPTLLANFIGPLQAGANPMIQVFCQGLVKEIAAEAWLKHYLAREDTLIVEVKALSPLQADAVVVRQTDDDVRLAVRIAAQIHGNRMFLVQCTAPEDLFESYADAFGIAVATFKPAHAMAQPSVEVRSNYRLDDALFFQMPYSWPFEKLEAPPGMDGYAFLNLDARSEPVGSIKVLSLRRALTEGKQGLDLPALLVSEFTKTGVEIAGLVREDDVPVRAPFTGGSIKVLQVRLAPGDETPWNLVVAALDTPAHHVLVGVLTCAPKHDFYLHSVNMRAFELVLETLEPVSES